MFLARTRLVLAVPLLLAALFVVSVCCAASQRRAIAIEDLQSIRNGFDGQLSPDGKFVVFAIMEPASPASKGPVSNLWTVSASGPSVPVRLTVGDHMNWLPRWSPDSK